MNFIEQIFGIAPDQGDGSMEWMLLGIIVLFISALALSQAKKSTTTAGFGSRLPEANPVHVVQIRIAGPPKR